MDCPRLNLARLGKRGLYILGEVAYWAYGEGASAVPLIVAKISKEHEVDPREVAEDIETLDLLGDNYRAKWARHCAEVMRLFPEERDFYVLGAIVVLLDTWPGLNDVLRFCLPSFYKMAVFYLFKKWLICAPPAISMKNLLVD